MFLKIKINKIEKIIKDHGLDEDGSVTMFLRDKIDEYCDPYVPFANGSGGHLKTLKTYPNNHSIKYEAPYAHYHYVGKKAIGKSRPEGVKRTISNEDMKYQGTPTRGPEWDKRMMNDKRKDVIMICPLSSRQVKYLKFVLKNDRILCGHFSCTPFFFIFFYTFIFRYGIFYWSS